MAAGRDWEGEVKLRGTWSTRKSPATGPGTQSRKVAKSGLSFGSPHGWVQALGAEGRLSLEGSDPGCEFPSRQHQAGTIPASLSEQLKRPGLSAHFALPGCKHGLWWQ